MWGGTSSIPGTVRPLSFYQLTTLHVFMLITQYSRKKEKTILAYFCSVVLWLNKFVRVCRIYSSNFCQVFCQNWIAHKKFFDKQVSHNFLETARVCCWGDAPFVRVLVCWGEDTAALGEHTESSWGQIGATLSGWRADLLRHLLSCPNGETTKGNGPLSAPL